MWNEKRFVTVIYKVCFENKCCVFTGKRCRRFVDHWHDICNLFMYRHKENVMNLGRLKERLSVILVSVIFSSIMYCVIYVNYLFNKAFIDRNAESLPFKYLMAKWFGHSDWQAFVITGLICLLLIYVFSKDT